MKTKDVIILCCTALIIFFTWFGWQRYAEHKQRLEHEAQERQAGYDRCVEQLNDFSTPETAKMTIEARKGCTQFWFGSGR